MHRLHFTISYRHVIYVLDMLWHVFGDQICWLWHQWTWSHPLVMVLSKPVRVQAMTGMMVFFSYSYCIYTVHPFQEYFCQPEFRWVIAHKIFYYHCFILILAGRWPIYLSYYVWSNKTTSSGSDRSSRLGGRRQVVFGRRVQALMEMANRDYCQQ